MNDWDKNNFAFMQQLPQPEFEQWILELSDEDVDYAISLYQKARAELELVEAEIFDDVPHVNDARAVLSRIACR